MKVIQYKSDNAPHIQIEAAALLVIDGDRVELYVEGTLTATIDNMTRHVTLSQDWDASRASIYYIRAVLCDLAEVEWDELTEDIIRPYLEPVRPDDAAAYFERNHLAELRDYPHQTRPSRTKSAN